MLAGFVRSGAQQRCASLRHSDDWAQQAELDPRLLFAGITIKAQTVTLLHEDENGEPSFSPHCSPPLLSVYLQCCTHPIDSALAT